MILSEMEIIISSKISEMTLNDDPAHDFLHFKRVVQNAKRLCDLEKAKIEVVMPAAWLHDFVVIPKNDSRRKIASRLSAEEAVQFLKSVYYPEIYLDEIFHAIEAHSFSAGIKPQSLEACIIQDADRLDALGAIGIARCFATAGLLKRPFYAEQDPFCSSRPVDDSQFTLDHFYQKLFLIAETLKTQAARTEGLQRVLVMKKYLSDLNHEI